MNNSNNRQSLTTSELIKNSPFPSHRHNQEKVLNEICNAFNSGCKCVILEAPTGFGKSPVAISIALSLGSSYICNATKDLQTQYSKDFPYLKVAKGKSNFACLVKEDFIRNGTYRCGSCASSDAVVNDLLFEQESLRTNKSHKVPSYQSVILLVM